MLNTLGIVTGFIFLLFLFFIFLCIHEIGHYCFARIFNIKVVNITIGYGKVIKTTTLFGVPIIIKTFPIVGLVRMLDEREGKVDKLDFKYTFNRKKTWKKAIVIIAGPTINLIFAISCCFIINFSGFYSHPVIVQKTIDNSLAAEVLQPQDRIIKINNVETLGLFKINMHFVSNLGKNVIVTVNRKGVLTEVSISLEKIKLSGKKGDVFQSIGVVIDQDAEPIWYDYDFVTSIKKACSDAGWYCYFNFIMIYNLIVGIISFNALFGPIEFLINFSNLMYEGFISILFFSAMLNIALFVTSLLPIPGLDGGHILFMLVESISGKPVSIAWQVLLYRLSLIILFVFFAHLVSNDIRNLVLIRP